MAEMSDYQMYIAQSRYARFRSDLGRRETWSETVDRLIAFWADRHPELTIFPELRQAVFDLEVMPSMRTLMTAGLALTKDNVAGYNCSYVPIESLRDLDELMYILLCGTGVGYSVEARYVRQIPECPDTLHPSESTIVVSDSKIGWASSYRELLTLLWAGKLPKYDLSRVRPSGSPLKTFGGRASGPGPLKDLFDFTIAMVQRARGRNLSTLEVHDLVCKIADVVVVGGVRRSALICLCDLGDDSMRLAKSGNWWVDHPHRALANISAVYESKPAFNVFLKEWHSLYDSYSGERGIFSRIAAKNQAAKNGRREVDFDWGTNPCSEIILRPRQFCNLSEVVVRAGDNLENLKRKVRLATILGTLQSTLTNFRYLRKEWQRNTEDERLLGVSLTGICDHEILSSGNDTNEAWLQALREVAVETNKEWAAILGIPASAAITCVKPSGTVSQLVDSSSGIHPRFAPYYLRAVRADKKDPLAQFMIDQGFPYEEDVMKPDHQYVFYFPQKSPEGSLFVDQVSAMKQMQLWETYSTFWCEHKPSVTVYYKDNEFLGLGEYVYNNFNTNSGTSFLPVSDHVYKQAPYQTISKEVYEAFVIGQPKNVDWSLAAAYDKGEDKTEGVQQLSCSAGVCEL